MIITKSGLIMLEKMVRSCPPTPTNGGMSSKEYLLGLCKQGKEITFIEFRKNFPRVYGVKCLYDVYEHINEYLESEGITKIKEEDIIRFFAGRPHIERAIIDIKDEGLVEIIGASYADKALVSHVLLPVEIIGKDGKYFYGIYHGAEMEIHIKNLVPFPEAEHKITVGGKVLTHYASIVSSDVDPKMEKEIIKNQSKNADFMKACATVLKQKGIDHKKMLHFPWAEKVLSLCGF
jgi:hypothetical protein